MSSIETINWSADFALGYIFHYSYVAEKKSQPSLLWAAMGLFVTTGPMKQIEINCHAIWLIIHGMLSLPKAQALTLENPQSGIQ